MITTKTLLILGAGASMPYGFPSGNGLYRKIALDHSEIGTALVRAGFRNEEVESFAAELLNSGRLSVDSFLEFRSDCQEIGKSAMATVLRNCECGTLLMNPEVPSQDWYRWLFNRLTEDCKADNIAGNTLRIVTFNYDRSFEHFMYMSLKHSFGMSPESIRGILESFSITHVYGSLGNYAPARSDNCPYEPRLGKVSIRDSASSILVMSDERVSEAFEVAKKNIQWAKRIVFLGFGFDRLNLNRLGLFGPGRIRLSEVDVGGTMYGMEDAERTRVIEDVFGGGGCWGSKEQDCLAFLRSRWNLD